MLNQGATLISRLAVFFAVLFTLAACGGGGGGGATFFDGDDPVPPPVTPAYLVQLTLLDANGAPISSLPQLAEGTLQIVVIENQEAGIPVAGALVNVSTSIGSLVPTNGRALTDANGVKNSSHDGKEENSAKVVEKWPVWHKEAGIKYDGRQHTEKEDG